MSSPRKALLGALAAVGAITGLHLWLNVEWTAVLNEYLPEEERKLNVAFIPVT